MTWQKYKYNLRNTLLLGIFFQLWSNFMLFLAQTIDSTLGSRCTLFGYQYSEILRSMMCVYLCGGSCLEDISTHLIKIS